MTEQGLIDQKMSYFKMTNSEIAILLQQHFDLLKVQHKENMIRYDQIQFLTTILIDRELASKVVNETIDQIESNSSQEELKNPDIDTNSGL